jgi:hypothetical protein
VATIDYDHTDSDVEQARQVCVTHKAKAAIILWFTPGKTEVDAVGFAGASYGVDGLISKNADILLEDILEAMEGDWLEAKPLVESIENAKRPRARPGRRKRRGSENDDEPHKNET